MLFVLGLWQAQLHHPWTRAISLDNQLYFHVAERVAAGVPPHVSLVDHKHALSAMLSGWAMAAGRAVGIDDVVSVRVVSIAVTAWMAPALWLLAYGITRNALVAHFTALLSLTFEEFFAQGASGVRPQLFMAVFMTQGFAAIASGRMGRAGALSIASFLCWQPALVAFASTSLALLIARGPWSRLVRYVAGGAAALGLYEIYFAYHGALGTQLYQSYALRSDLSGHVIEPLRESLGFVLRGGRWGEGWAVVFPAVFLLALAYAWVEPLVRPRWVWKRWRDDPLPGAVATTALLALAFTLIDHQAYPDRFILQPFVALANGVVWGNVVLWAAWVFVGDSHRRLIATAAFALPATALAVVMSTARNPVESRLTLAGQRELAARVSALRSRYGPVWAIGCPHLLALVGMGNHDSVGVVLDPKVRAYIAAGAGEDGYRPSAGMPAVMITSRGGEGHAFPWLRREYWPVPDAGFADHGIRVWLRKECLVDKRKCPSLFECLGTPACRRSRAQQRSPK